MTRAELLEKMARSIGARLVLRGSVNDAATDALAAIEAAGLSITSKGLWETLWNGHNCVVHEEDNDPPSVENAIRISRDTLREASGLLAASPLAKEPGA